MQALRERFQPEARKQNGQPFPSATSSPKEQAGVLSKDYFNFEPTSPTVKAPSLPSYTPHATTPAATTEKHRTTAASFGMTQVIPEMAASGPTHDSIAAVLSPDTAVRHSTKYMRRTSAMRKQVAAGDLAMSSTSGSSKNDGAYYRPSARTPGLPRMDTWRGQNNNSWNDFTAHPGGVHVEEPTSDGAEEEFELRDAVLECIARSIGLSQPTPDSQTENTSHAPSVSAFSTPNSPMFPTNTGRPSSRSHFGNVLDMMNASSHNDNLIGGMIREAVHNARAGDGDEASSVSASVQESGMGASAFYDSRGVLKDLEGNVEILYYKKGSVLVKEGEKSPGIYYVVDGFLEVSPLCGHR
jgi:lysophospholipid hydrolase